MKIIAFFNNKGGVGTTTLAYHMGWMLSDLNCRVVMADLDPQANLSSMFLDEDRLDELWPTGKHPCTIQGVLEPIIRGIGDIGQPHLEEISDEIGLIVGDLGLSTFEDRLSESWPKCHNRDEAAFRVMTAFYRAMLRAANDWKAEYVLVDVGPNLGAINRSALIAADHVIVTLASDLFSLQGLRTLGPQLRDWRAAWQELRLKNPDHDLPLPAGKIAPLGYVLRQDRPMRWMNRIPGEYRESVLSESPDGAPTVEQDPHCLASLKHYRSLMPMAMEARKPMFHLRPADGAIGAHVAAVLDCGRDFQRLTERIMSDIAAPQPLR